MKTGMKAGAVALAAVLGLACEQGFTITGTIEVPIEVQKAFSAVKPGRIMITKVGPYTMGTLCDPTDKPIVLPFFHDELGCAAEMAVTVFVEPVTVSPVMPASCGLGQLRPRLTRDDLPMEDRAVATAREVVFKGYHGRGCDSAKDEVHLVLQLKEAASPSAP